MRRKIWLRRLNKLFRGRRIKRPPRKMRVERVERSPTGRRGKGYKQKSFIPRRYIAFFMVIVLLTAFGFSFYRFDRRILPMVLEAAELELQMEINNVINQVVQEIIVQHNVTAEDFFVLSNVDGANPVLSVNTVLVNDICNAAAQRISHLLNNLEPKVASVPMGMAFGLDTLAQTGPRFNFRIAPIGNALVNYDSSFVAVGINQIHFSVWLTVESVVRIINPVHSSEIVVVRHVSLVDTVISGAVPDTFLNMDVPSVTLNP